jgi:periplasmic copper chaperone A
LIRVKKRAARQGTQSLLRAARSKELLSRLGGSAAARRARVESDAVSIRHCIVLFLVAGIAFAQAAAAQVVVTDAWVRGTVAGQTTTGAFMQLKSAADATLVGAASPVATIVEVHEMKMDGGMMKMSAVGRLPLPAGKTIDLKPGGYHVMLMGLTAPLRAGDTVPLTLTFEDKAGKKTAVEVKAPVKPLTTAGALTPK